MGNMTPTKRVKIQVEKDIADRLTKLKAYGESYSSVIGRLLKKA